MDAAFLTLEEVLLRIVEKLPHAAETELTHLKDSVRAFFAENSSDNADVTPAKEEEKSDGSVDNPPVA